MVLFSWEDWGALCLGECLWPCLTNLVGLLDWPIWGELLPSPEGRWAVARGELLPLPGGRWAIARELGGTPVAWLFAWGMLLPSLGGRRAVAWEAWEELLPMPEGRWAAAGRELLPLPGRRWAIARELGGMPAAWLFVWGILLPSLGGRRAVAWEEPLLCLRGGEPLPGENCFLPRKVSNCWRRVRRDAWCLTAY